jgi:hypothetical protein
LFKSSSVGPDVEEEESNPLVLLLFEFFTEPNTSKFGTWWGYFIGWLVVIHVLAVGLKTCDGPNQYVGRENHATYSFLLSADGYFVVDLVCLIPLVIDAAGRCLLLVFIFFSRENRSLRNQLIADSFASFLLACDIIGVVPFFIEMGYTRRNNVVLSSGSQLMMRLVDLLLTGRILRITKDMPAAWAIRISLRRSAEHLILPFFVFLVFNITGAVIFYFAEPCYNNSNSVTCPWKDLFEASFFSVVSMSTSKRHLFVFYPCLPCA